MPSNSNRRKRSDSAEVKAGIAAAAVKVIKSERVSLSPEEIPFFDAIIAERAKVDWTKHKIDTAAILAKLMYSVILNPDEKGVAQKHNAIISYRRSLGIHSRAQDGEMQDFEDRREVARKLEEGVVAATDDDLIARPPMH